LLFVLVFQLHFLHSYCCEVQNFENVHNFQQQMQTIFYGYFVFSCPWTSCLSHSFFSFAHHLLINAWSLKLIRPITTSLCVFCTAMWKHLTSSLWMNIIDFIFWILHIHNRLTLSVLIPLRLPYTPSINYENTSNDCTKFLVDHAHNSNDCASTPDDQMNIVANSSNMPDISSVDFYIPNLVLLQLLFFWRSKIKIVFTIGSIIYYLSSSFFNYGFYSWNPSSSSCVSKFAS
jgi:hypothetical protein